MCDEFYLCVHIFKKFVDGKNEKGSRLSEKKDNKTINSLPIGDIGSKRVV